MEGYALARLLLKPFCKKWHYRGQLFIDWRNQPWFLLLCSLENYRAAAWWPLHHSHIHHFPYLSSEVCFSVLPAIIGLFWLAKRTVLLAFLVFSFAKLGVSPRKVQLWVCLGLRREFPGWVRLAFFFFTPLASFLTELASISRL